MSGKAGGYEGAGEFLRIPVLALRPKVGNHEVTQETYNHQLSFGKDFHAIFQNSKKEHDSLWIISFGCLSKSSIINWKATPLCLDTSVQLLKDQWLVFSIPSSGSFVPKHFGFGFVVSQLFLSPVPLIFYSNKGWREREKREGPWIQNVLFISFLSCGGIFTRNMY